MSESAKKVDNIVDFDPDKKGGTLKEYFYKVHNHIDLFKIGKSFYTDFREGLKSFAIASTGFPASQQQTLLGIASFFDHEELHLNILIVSDALFDGAYKDILAQSHLNEVSFADSDLTCEVHSFHGYFDFLDLYSLVKERKLGDAADYDVVLDLLFESYDIIMWDVPPLETLKKNPNDYFPIITKFDCLSIIVSNNVSKTKDAEKICEFFSSYGLSLKGLLIDSASMRDDDEKKPWWKRIFG